MRKNFFFEIIIFFYLFSEAATIIDYYVDYFNTSYPLEKSSIIF